MEDENIAQAIPNSEASAWMEKNIPLFDCPQKNFEEMFYYRWWTLRKHIKQTPVGYGMTEFLVNRSYADKYNLIACAIGHHIYESRWLRDSQYLDQIIHTWYRGNEGGPMKKMEKFSSWNIDAMLGRYLVDGNMDFLGREMCRMVWKNPSAAGAERNMPVPLSIVICTPMLKRSLT